jgi:hypothetical protein
MLGLDHGCEHCSRPNGSDDQTQCGDAKHLSNLASATSEHHSHHDCTDNRTPPTRLVSVRRSRTKRRPSDFFATQKAAVEAAGYEGEEPNERTIPTMASSAIPFEWSQPLALRIPP